MTLADCHNPKNGCFPSQDYLRDASEMSNGALNENLRKLEDKGLILRERKGNRVVGGRAPTRYILGFETDLSPETGDKVNSGPPEKTPGKLRPTGDNVNSGPPETKEGVNSGIPGGKLRPTGVEPVRTGKQVEPVKVIGSENGSKRGSGFEAFWAVYPKRVKKKGAEAKFRAAIKSGVDLARLVSAAETYAKTDRVRRGYVLDPTTWLNNGCWDDDPAEGQPAAEASHISKHRYIAEHGTSKGWHA